VMVDGWLRTGDLARRDEDGFFAIIGRSKDLIISGGENVYPAEVESVLASHPAVAEVAVIPVPDPKWGEVPRAVVVLGEGCRANAEELLAFAKAKLAGYKVPKSVVFVEALPKTGVGKLDKRALTLTHGRA
jgi:fatty-acyl-CoA synthase